jgi:hypothetical protein
MKLIHHLDPLLRITPKSDNIQTFGCYQVSLNFMLKFDGIEDIKGLTELVPKMTKAACDVIEASNKAADLSEAKGGDLCPGTLEEIPTVATTLSEQPPEKSSLIL